MYKIEFPDMASGITYCEKRGIDMAQIRTYKLNEVIPFSSRLKSDTSRVLSNMYRCKLRWNGKEFGSVEHAFHYFCLSENPLSQQRILTIDNPFDVKATCKTMEMDSDYLKKRWKVLKFCLNLKYEQCEKFRKILEDSGDIPLVEYAEWGDVFYGTCKFLNKDEEWLIGQNACGRLMMQIRLEHKEAGE